MAKANILVVEDELLIAQDIKETLQDFDYNVVGVVDNGQDAINIAKTKKPDLILMDIIIKGPWDGIKTTEELHAEIDIPVIYLTSHADNERLQRAKITEPYGYITKPFDEKTLHTTIEVALYKRKTENEKLALKEQVVKLNRTIPLTDNEKNVFYGLINYPSLNDIELGRVLKLKRSTVTAIRNRLLKEKYFDIYRMPDFGSLGCELLTFMHSDLHGPKELSSMLLKELSKSSEQIYTAITNNKFTGICISKSFADAKKHLDHISSYLKNQDISNELSFIHFPLHESALRNFFDFSTYMKKRFEIQKDYDLEKTPKIKIRNYSKNEKNILYALVKYPAMSDVDLSEKTKIPRPSISQTRRTLEKEGLIKTINIPSLTMLRSELCIMNTFSLEEIKSEKNADIMNYLKTLPSNILMVSDETDLCTINIYDDYTEYEQEKSLLADFFHENFINKKSEIILTMQNSFFMSFSYSSLVKKLLDINPDF